MKKSVFLVVALAFGAALAYSLMLPPREDGEPGADDSAAPADAGEAASGQLHIYNWTDYISESAVGDFESEFGIQASYDVYDSNEVLDGKLLAGHTGFDIVVPSDNFLWRQIQAGALAEIDKSRLANYDNLDAELMAQLAAFDPGNKHSIPYLWGTTGIAYNPDKVRAALGEDAPTDSWALLMEPGNLERLSACGVAFLDAPTDMIPATLNYLGEDPNSRDTELVRGAVLKHLLRLRPHLRYIHSSRYIDDLANGEICAAVGWSGDVFQAADNAAEGVRIEYTIPKEGASLWFDVIAIPKDAANIDNAHLFIDYLLRPQVIADITNYVSYANPNAMATELVDEDIRNNPGIYPPSRDRLFVVSHHPPEVDRVYTDVWRSFLSKQSPD